MYLSQPTQPEAQIPQLPPFEKTNTLISRDSPPSHKIINLLKKQQNIELVFIILSKFQQIKTKKDDTIIQCLIADQTACIYMNFFNQTANIVEQGDIIYASGIYLSYFKDMRILYQGAMSIVKRVGRHFFRFNMSRNLSLESFEQPPGKNQGDNKNVRKY